MRRLLTVIAFLIALLTVPATSDAQAKPSTGGIRTTGTDGACAPIVCPPDVSACECAARSLKQASFCANGQAAQIALLQSQLDAEKRAHIDDVASERVQREKDRAESTRELEKQRRKAFALGGVAGAAVAIVVRIIIKLAAN